MKKVLTEGSDIRCQHRGKFTTTNTQSVLKIDGKEVLVGNIQGSIEAVAPPNSCTQRGASQTPCSQIASQIPVVGLSNVLKVNSIPVALDSASGTTNGNPTNNWSVDDANQTVLQAD